MLHPEPSSGDHLSEITRFDADLGQKLVGPPACVTLAQGLTPVPTALSFVGTPDPLRGWQRLKRSGAWGETVVRSRRRGAVARMTFQGRRVALIGRKLRRGGRVRI